MASTIRTRLTKIEKKIEKKFEERLDQVLLGLQHRGLNLKEFKIKDSQDVVQKLGRRILERADEVRAEIAKSPYSPAWLKDVTLTPRSSDVVDATAGEKPVSDVSPTAAASMSDATASSAAEGMLADDLETVTSRSKKTTKMSGKLAKKAGKKSAGDKSSSKRVH